MKCYLWSNREWGGKGFLMCRVYTPCAEFNNGFIFGFSVSTLMLLKESCTWTNHTIYFQLWNQFIMIPMRIRPIIVQCFIFRDVRTGLHNFLSGCFSWLQYLTSFYVDQMTLITTWTQDTQLMNTRQLHISIIIL